jgi:hypothetical protein
MAPGLRESLIKARRLLQQIDEALVRGDSARELLAEAHATLEEAGRLHGEPPKLKLTAA